MGIIVRRLASRNRMLAGLLMALALSSASAQSPRPTAQPALTTDQVVAQLVQHNRDRAALLKHYESCRYYAVNYMGFPSGRSAEMLVDMQFNAPAQKEFRIVKQQGSRLLLDHVLGELIQTEKEALDKDNLGHTDLTPDNYQFRLVGTETVAGQLEYVLEVTPRFKSKFLYHGKIWVDASDFAVSRLSAQPAKNVSFWISHSEIQHEYKKVGEFWLPAHNTSVAHVRFGGTAKLTIDYRDYRIGPPRSGSSSNTCAGSGEVELSQKH